mmetsp:Transcript_39136/g.85860  ORF Transcript_39136/g.85860 Transcript_39136/m.85860 type:complete len:477 (+) Transcript_39136:118-1548(+)
MNFSFSSSTTFTVTTVSVLLSILTSNIPICQAKDLIVPSKVHRDANTGISHVVHVVADGLRPDAMVNYPNFNWLRANGVGTDNARNQLESAQTLPNHISMFTGLSVAEHGHYLDGESKDKLELVNIFDLVKASGGTTAFYGAKEKFATFQKNWNIDSYTFTKWGNRVITGFMDDMATNMYTYAFVHFRETDLAGHRSTGATTVEYANAVQQMDEYLGQLLQFIEQQPSLKGKTAVILTTDHGFEDVGNHNDLDDPFNYKIPLYVWGPSPNVLHGEDMYALNGLQDPGDARITPSAIHNSYSGVLAAQLLGISYEDGPFADQYLSISGASTAPKRDVPTIADLGAILGGLGQVNTNGGAELADDPLNCVTCPNDASQQMAANYRTCESWRLTATKCKAPSNQWTRNQICKRSCYFAGYPYDSDICCSGSSIEVNKAEMANASSLELSSSSSNVQPSSSPTATMSSQPSNAPIASLGV